MAKVTITQDEEKQFKPFDLTITVESKEELAVLWAIFNCSVSDVCKNASKYEPLVTHYFNSNAYFDSFKSVIWNKLDAIFRSRK